MFPPGFCVALLASRIRTEEREILAVLERRGVPHQHVDTRRLWYELHEEAPPWTVVLNREISWTKAVYAARTLEDRGVAVVNPASVIEMCGDKWRTSMALRRAAVATPRTALALTPQAADEAIEAFGYPVLVKPLVASWGRRIALIRDRDSARNVLEHCEALPSPQAHVIYVQEFVDKPGRDIRVLVIGGQPLGAMYRYSADWRTNVAGGAWTAPCPLSPEIAKLALEAATAVGAEIAGVDLVEYPDGELRVLEVNHGVEFDGFQAALPSVGVAEAIVDHLLTRTGVQP